MYYYILESPQSRTTRATYQKLRDMLTNLGIAGEMVGSNPARTPTELAQMGISKGYSTIVAVGGDHHINEIATAIIGRATLGVIPIDASPLVEEITGVTSINNAVETLKYRRVSLQSTVLVEPETILFLCAYLTSPTLAKASLVIDNKVRAHAYYNQIRVNRFLEVDLVSEHQTESKKILGIFKTGGNIIRSHSHFHGKNIRIVTDPIKPLIVAGIEIAKTPLQFRLIPESLKVITRRGTLTE